MSSSREYKLPDLGEGVHEGEIVKWLVKEGSSVSMDQPLVEVMTDKATVEIPAPLAGKVQKLHAKEGDIVKIGKVLITFSETTGSAKASSEKTTAPAQKSTPTQMPQATMQSQPQMQSTQTRMTGVASTVSGYVASPGNVLAAPSTRRLARELGVDLTQVPPTGPKGRVTKEDVQRFGGAVAAGPQVPVRSTTMGSQTTARPMTATKSVTSVLDLSQKETLIPFRGIRRKIAEAMTKSRSTIPEFTYVDECDVTELVSFRTEAKALLEKQGVKLTYMPFICKAVIRALKAFPYLNAQLDEQGGNIILKNYYNIGIAVDTDDGLVVPVVKNVDQKSIVELAREMTTLTEKARARQLALDDVHGGTFTITNAGTIGGMLATPIINWPEVAILGVHKISKRPMVKTVEGKDQIVIGQSLWLSVAVDHRVVDGAVAARFLNIVMESLSDPKRFMLDMMVEGKM